MLAFGLCAVSDSFGAPVPRALGRVKAGSSQDWLPHEKQAKRPTPLLLQETQAKAPEPPRKLNSLQATGNRCSILLYSGLMKLAIAALLVAGLISAQTSPEAGSLNKPERLEWFRDQGFGLFIHWSVDSQLGVVISHSLAGASDDYTRRFFTELPKTFNPHKFYPSDLASLAKLAGVRYVVFTTKHHSGFCMWDTKTTDFSIAHTPFKRDITAELLDAFRARGIAAGVYYSPDDFWWLWKHNITINRRPEVQPPIQKELLEYDQSQVGELMTNYGKIDVVFFDGPYQGLRDIAWQLQPDTVVTRGAITTPEQYVPGIPLEGAWEANLTMGTAWQYQPRNEVYKPGGDLIALLYQTRAKGGNLLLNVGPKPDGELPIEQEERLRELALWMFVNQECIYGVRPWVVTNEQSYWFTKKKNEDTVYVVVTEPWKRGDWKDILLHSVRATAQTEASVLGQNDQVLEYSTSVIPKTTYKQDTDSLHVHAMFAQRLQDNSKWPNPIVLKLTHVKPALTPPQLQTGRAVRQSGNVRLEASLLSLGDAKEVRVRFEYRSLKGLDVNERSGTWQTTPLQPMTAPGSFSASVPSWQAGEPYEFRAVVQHPLLTMYGDSRKVSLR
jgi:alpha-L-fucosidase